MVLISSNGKLQNFFKLTYSIFSHANRPIGKATFGGEYNAIAIILTSAINIIG